MPCTYNVSHLDCNKHYTFSETIPHFLKALSVKLHIPFFKITQGWNDVKTELFIQIILLFHSRTRRSSRASHIVMRTWEKKAIICQQKTIKLCHNMCPVGFSCKPSKILFLTKLPCAYPLVCLRIVLHFVTATPTVSMTCFPSSASASSCSSSSTSHLASPPVRVYYSCIISFVSLSVPKYRGCVFMCSHRNQPSQHLFGLLTQFALSFFLLGFLS